MRGNLIPVIELMDQHLLAEWRELKMVPAALKKSLRNRSIEQVLAAIPPRFVLGKGHIIFWYNKLNFLTDRYAQLTTELLNRGVNLKYRGGFEMFTKGIPEVFFQDYHPTSADIATSRARIEEKIAMKPKWYKKTSYSSRASKSDDE